MEQPCYYLVKDPSTGLCHPTQLARKNGKMCRCSQPQSWNALPASQYQGNPRIAGILSPGQLSAAYAQIGMGAAGVGNSMQLADLPNNGAPEVVRVDGSASPTQGDITYALILNNSAGATAARIIMGDVANTYQLLGNAQVLPAGFVIDGEFTTSSLTHATARQDARAWGVKRIRFETTVSSSWYASNPVSYFNTSPNSNGAEKQKLSLSSLATGDQFNPKIQFYDRSVKFDGVNGLDIAVPAGETVTILFTIGSEEAATLQGLLK